jgi:Spy/CpxP family protein refolding chaperone
MIRFSRTLGAAGAIFLLAGCGGGPTDTVPDQNVDQKESEITSVPDKPVRESKTHAGRGRGHGGPAHLLRAALDELTLTADQKQKVEGLLENMKQAGPGPSVESRALQASIQKSVQSGSFDDAALAKHYIALEGEARQNAEKMQNALNELHQTLTAEQRSELVQKLQARMKDGPLGKDGKHEREAKGGRPGKERHGRRFGKGFGFEKRALADLDLTDEQRQKLESARDANESELSGKGEWKTRAEGMLTAFGSASFDAKKLMDAGDMAKHARTFAEMRVKRARTLVEILTPEQRAKYAASLESRSHGEKE